MYGFQQLNEVTPEQLLQKVSQEEIFELILGEPFSYHSRYCSPFRNDTHPNCRFEMLPNGNITFIDFGERNIHPDRTHRGVFSMVMDYFNVTLDGAISVICDKFGLSKYPCDYSPIITHVDYDNKRVKVRDTKISYVKRAYNRFDVKHWSQFFITTDQLASDNVFASSKFTVDGRKGVKTITPFRYCYVMDFIDKIKIYQPYKVNYKWTTNCDENCVGNIDNLPATGNRLIIKKSYKDHRIIRNLDDSSNVIWFQNEGQIPSMEILANLVQRFPEIVIFFDNDESGRAAAERVVAVFNSVKENCCSSMTLPEIEQHKKLYGHYLKDPGEFISKEGRKDTIQVLKQIGLLYGSNT